MHPQSTGRNVALSNRIMKWARQLLRPFESTQQTKKTPDIISRSNHTISRNLISPNALKVLYRLKDAGYCAYLVGGSVRDILLGRVPKDFDVATNAHPDAVRHIFRNSRIIGRRFRLVHVFFHDEIIEVSTFRANMIEETRTQKLTETGMISQDNAYGTIEEDAWRRDFTINALYYNIADFSVVDYTGGMSDLNNRLIRMIGDPTQRYHEDPVRLLRAIRLSAKLNIEIEAETESSLKALSHLLKHVPTSRLFDEWLKLFFEGNAWVTYQKLLHYGYLNTLFPQTMAVLSSDSPAIAEKLIQMVMEATDKRIQEGNSVNSGFLLAVLLWPVLSVKLVELKNKKIKFFMQLHQLIHQVIERQIETLMIPRRLQFTMQAIWILQFHLEKRRPKRIFNVFHHRYFRAAFDFMELRVRAGEISSEKYEWWNRFQLAHTDEQKEMIEKLG